MSLLPDSGIGYMIVNSPNAGLTLGTNANCTRRAGHCRQLPAATERWCRSSCRARPQAAAYTFAVGSTGAIPARRSASRSTKATPRPSPTSGAPSSTPSTTSTTRSTASSATSPTGTHGHDATIIPMLALQGNLAMPERLPATSPTYLMATLRCTQTGSGTFNGTIIGPGGLTLQSGNVTLGGAQHLHRRHGGERRHAHHRQHRLDHRQPHGQSGRQLRQQRHGQHAGRCGRLNQGTLHQQRHVPRQPRQRRHGDQHRHARPAR